MSDTPESPHTATNPGDDVQAPAAIETTVPEASSDEPVVGPSERPAPPPTAEDLAPTTVQTDHLRVQPVAAFPTDLPAPSIRYKDLAEFKKETAALIKNVTKGSVACSK